MASNLSSKGKASSFRGLLDLSRLFTTKSQQERYGTYFFQKKIMKPKYGSFVSFPDDVFSFPTIFEELGLSDLIGYNTNFYPELVKVFYSNMVKKKGKLTYVVKGVPISLTTSDISAIFEIPTGGHKFVGTKDSWEDYSKHAFYYSLSRLSEHQFYNKRKKSFGGDNSERVYWSPTEFSIDDRMLHYFVVNRKMRVIYNHRTHEVKYLDNDDEEPQPEAHNDDNFNPPLEAQPDQPSNQMIMEYLQGFRTDVMTEIGHLSSRMDHWEFSQSGYQGGGYQGGGSNYGNNNQ
ncbi:hypothetical protein KIW84_035670 [Lathyrus oleraceus]|uniref:Uncharacterized protein n=1 Tax=Pisum sativum TaxID=3888 RepID=A0A9D4Y4C3_PEA|nr:hypothetical protein KIW84_035670 [Pisum sativum]